MSSNYYLNNKESTIKNKSLNPVSNIIESYAAKAYRTLAAAHREITKDEVCQVQKTHKSKLTVLSIFGIMDPPRPEVIESIETCRRAGIKTVMITGDHAVTAREIAKQVGIIKSKKDIVVKGSEIDSMSDKQLAKTVKKAVVFARVSPEHKQRIVKAFQKNSHITAMTGDGINDAPALRNAEIGIAMGIAGTQVAKESSDLILTDDNFATIVSAITHGRRIYDNVRKFIRESVTANIAEFSSVIFAFTIMYDRPEVPLTAIMILWINLFSDAFPALMLGWEKDKPGLMKRKLRSKSENFFSDGLGVKIIVRGLTNGFFVYLVFSYFMRNGYSSSYAQTSAFLALIFVQNYHIFDTRTFAGIFNSNPFNNMKLVTALMSTIFISILFTYTSWGCVLLGTSPMKVNHLTMIIILAALPTFILSGVKKSFNLKWL